MIRMWNLVTVLLFISFTTGQNQFHREVVNPNGPSQILLSGGLTNANGEDFAAQQGQGIPLQSSDAGNEQPIPDDGNNGFTDGNAGFGLRYQSPQQPAQAPVSIAPQPVQQQPQLVQEQPQLVQQQPQLIQQPQQLYQTPIFQQSPLILPQLLPGQQYLDVYGRIITVQHPQEVQPQPSPSLVTTPQPAQLVQKQVLVDTYGRKLAEIQVPSPSVQTLALPVVPALPGVHQVIEPASVPAFQNIIKPVELSVPVVKKLIQQEVLVAKKEIPPPLTLHTYAVPAVRKVGNLEIPYAQKVVYAKTPDLGVVFHPTVPAVAEVKSKINTVFSPVAAASAAPHIIAPHQQILLEQPQLAVHQPQLLQYVDQAHQVPFAHHQLAAQQPLLFQYADQTQIPFAQQQPLFSAVEQAAAIAPPGHVIHDAHPHAFLPAQYAGLPVQVNQVVHLTSPPGSLPLISAPAPVVVKKVKPAAEIFPAVAKIPVIEKTIVPDVTLIHQPVFPKVLFQRHIFNVKHGSEPVIYQDLCTVYPYQKNLRACALKKAVLPELHHPDIRTMNVEDEPHQQQPTMIAGGSAIIAPAQPSNSQTTVTISKDHPKNIQETIKQESAKSKEKAFVDMTSSTTTTTTVQPEPAESRESSLAGKSRRSRRNKKSKASTPATTEKPFKLA